MDEAWGFYGQSGPEGSSRAPLVSPAGGVPLFHCLRAAIGAPVEAPKAIASQPASIYSLLTFLPSSEKTGLPWWLSG